MGGKQATQLDAHEHRPRHQERNQDHRVRHQLGGDCEEEEVGLHTTLVLSACVRQGQDQALEVEARVPAQQRVDDLGQGSASTREPYSTMQGSLNEPRNVGSKKPPEDGRSRSPESSIKTSHHAHTAAGPF